MFRPTLGWRSKCIFPSRLLRIGAFLSLMVGSLSSLSLSLAFGDEPIDFDQQIRPLLSDRCYKCHGPDAETREADLRLDTIQDWSKLVASSSDRLVIHEASAAESELYQRLISEDEDSQMPPPDSGLNLSADDKETIRKWIDQGAKQTQHWSFVPIPKTVEPPQVPTEFQEWAKNEIDAFVLARQLAEGLQPNPTTSNSRLVRRLFLDLIGLPPTQAELDQWSTLPRTDLVTQLANELMQRPAFGEHLAAQWLDAARYSDTYGYQVDRDRFVWPWRDWVVRAFNQNMPYDQFLTQQIAGDLLPDANAEQILATTFCRLHPQKVEGGSVPEEFRVEYVSDRTQTFSTAYLGLTMECCRCHDHKYDPLSQENYFQLSSFFDNIDEAGLYSYFTDSIPTPTLVLPDESKDQQQQMLVQQINALQQKIAERIVQIEPTLSTLNATELINTELNTTELDAQIDSAIVGQQDFEAADVIGQQSENKIVQRQTHSGESKAALLSGDEGIGIPVGNFRRWEPFSISLWMNSPDRKERAVVLHRSRAWTDAASRGYELLLEEGKLKFSLIHYWPGNAISIRAKADFDVAKWQHVTVTYDGSSTAEGLAIFVDGKQQECEVIRNQLTKQIAGGGGDTITIGERFRDRGFKNGMVDDVKVFGKQLNAVEILRLYDRQTQTAADLAEAEQTGETQDGHDKVATTSADGDFDARDFAMIWAQANDETYQSLGKQLAESRQQLYSLQDGRQEIMVMRELPEPRDTYLLARGSYDAPTKKVETTTPEHVLPFPDDLPRNRLGLARWATDPANPLTARVVVNRYWQLIFGEGLVRTPEDFGNQGTPPTHPLLMDYLARDLVEHQWDIRRLILKIVQSATYQQDSNFANDGPPRDPENRFLTRYPNARRSAEVLRDQALSVSGLLNTQLGGAPVYTYDLGEAFSPSKFTEGEQQYRRSLYCYWKRTGPSPALMALDAAQRDVCQVKRERTQTPSQALVLLNAPQFVEAARKIASQVDRGNPLDDQLREVYSRMLQRSPNSDELEVMTQLYNKQRSNFVNDEAAVESYLTVGQFRCEDAQDRVSLAALSSVVNTLFALDEFICRR